MFNLVPVCLYRQPLTFANMIYLDEKKTLVQNGIFKGSWRGRKKKKQERESESERERERGGESNLKN